MSDPNSADRKSADMVLRALRRTRQVRQFTDEPVAESDLRAILEVARWSGSSINRQPWTFVVIGEGHAHRDSEQGAPMSGDRRRVTRSSP